MINAVVPRQFPFDLNREISNKFPTPILLFIFYEYVSSLTSGKDIFRNYGILKRVCKNLHGYASDDFFHYLSINKITDIMMVNIFNIIIEKSSYRRSFFSMQVKARNELANRLKQLLVANKISDLILLTHRLLPNEGSYYLKAFERLIAKVMDQPFNSRKKEDHMSTLFFLECAKKDPRATAELFNKIPLVFVKSLELVGFECAINDPIATLDFIQNFSEKLIIKSSMGYNNENHFTNIIREANGQYRKLPT
jgi:hypothetical protein